MKTKTKSPKASMKKSAELPAFTCSILAIDLGKYKSVGCALDARTGEYQFSSLSTDQHSLVGLLERFKPGVVVIEACTLAGWVHDECVKLGYRCKVANTANEAWKFKHLKRKTDRDDALRLAQLESNGQLPTTTVPPKAVREKRALIASRQRLVSRRVAVQNRIRSILVGQGVPMLRGHRAWTEEGLRVLDTRARPLSECAPDDLWQGLLGAALKEYRHVVELIRLLEKKLDELNETDKDVEILRTVPGVGPRTAEAIANHLNDASRFKTGGQVSAFAGLVPKQFQSGELDRRGRITRRGPAVLRKLLVECGWCLIQYNSWARQVWLRLTHGGKTRRKQAIVALARKLLVRCWAMLRHRTPWRADPEPAAPEAA